MPQLNEIRKSEDIGYKSNGHKYIWVGCIQCGKERWVLLSKGKAVSSVCSKCAHTLYGELNHSWKGNAVSYASLHEWVRNNKPRPVFCMQCGVKPAFDVANISGEYLRDLGDWEWLCRTCHMTKDGRLAKIHALLPDRNRARARCMKELGK